MFSEPLPSNGYSRHNNLSLWENKPGGHYWLAIRLQKGRCFEKYLFDLIFTKLLTYFKTLKY
jgi:hypothetical protein